MTSTQMGPNYLISWKLMIKKQYKRTITKRLLLLEQLSTTTNPPCTKFGR